MNREFIAKHWYAHIYEQFENQLNDVEFLLKVLSDHTNGALSILEPACGGGRICVPLAQAGHTVTGFDIDEHMLLRCCNRSKGLGGLHCFKADALEEDWGEGYDVVILAGNILINIEAAADYEQAQEIFISKAARALRRGGRLYLDFDLTHNPAAVFNSLGEGSYFNGFDDMGTFGRTVSFGSVFDPVTRICSGTSHIEITQNNGERFILPEIWHKHIPTQGQVYGWLKKAGLSIERTYKNYSDDPLPEPLDEATYRATIWAIKN